VAGPGHHRATQQQGTNHVVEILKSVILLIWCLQRSTEPRPIGDRVYFFKDNVSKSGSAIDMARPLID
jgi:hypothetical protein